jgi:hypothetical protein
LASPNLHNSYIYHTHNTPTIDTENKALRGGAPKFHYSTGEKVVMKKILILLALVAIVAGAAFAETDPAFSGSFSVYYGYSFDNEVFVESQSDKMALDLNAHHRRVQHRVRVCRPGRCHVL